MNSKSCLISGTPFFFDVIQDWQAEKFSYIHAWKLAFSREGYEDRIDWLIGSPLNRTYILKDEAGAVAAAYSLCLNHLMLNGVLNEIAVCNNVFCIPKYQGLNLFVRIGRLALEDAAQKFLMVYGFPNRSAIAGHKRVGWSINKDISEISMKFSDLNLAHIDGLDSAKIREVSEISLAEQKFISSSLSVSASKIAHASDYGFGIVKSSDYYNWRFFQRPVTDDRSYWVLEYNNVVILFSIYNPLCQVNILDCQFDNIDSLGGAMKSLTNFSLSKKITHFKFLGTSSSLLYKGLKCFQIDKNQNSEDLKISMITKWFANKCSKEAISFLPATLGFLDNDVY